MVTFNQIKDKKTIRTDKKRRKRLLSGYPQKRGYCEKVAIVKPKKPNSAQRKIAKVVLEFGTRVSGNLRKRRVLAYIPGIGPHNLQEHSTVLIKRGRVPDLPGVAYHIIRGKYDFTIKESFSRHNRRSKFSVKRTKK
uniref:Ribosomal protein S12 n=1 Tax=Cavenderia fasciculata TaxID=261658 RepID=B2XX91_CACFS|nr:ribosomal protein S12 [Cavenderia fasciculata]ABX45213.1 ribosomal protein S12 [Cavenderia fasciculata]